MVGTQDYRGIQYSVERVADRRWRWRISPPLCVLGMREEAGEIEGVHIDAVLAAQRAIESQVSLS
jgi:hypothetical protein